LKKLSTESPPAVLLAALVLLPCWLSLSSHPDWLMGLSWAVAASFLGGCDSHTISNTDGFMV